MTFGHPLLLLLLLLLPIFAWLKGKRGEPPAFVYSSVQLVRGLLNVTRTRAGGFLSALRWLALALFIIALAQPRLTRSETKITASGVDIVAALDMSGSMISEDFEVHGKRVNLGTIDENQTAIGSALSTAINRLRELRSKTKIVILMTDGQNNAGKVAPLTVAEAAQALGVKVYTIGVGMRGMAPMPVYFGGRKVGYRQEPVDIDEDTLEKIAQMTGGKYYRADNAKKFQQIYTEIDNLEKSEAEIKKFTHHDELFAWVISPGLGLVLLEMVLRHTIWRRLP